MEKKHYPLNYTQDVLNVINALAYNPKDVNLAGSMALRSQLYAGDYDLFEIVKSQKKDKTNAIASFVTGFKRNVKQLMELPDCYIGDIKAGVVEDWIVVEGDIQNMKVVGYSYEKSKSKLEKLHEEGIVTDEEMKEAMGVLKKQPTPAQFLDIQKTIRPEIVRWSVKDIMNGFVVLRNGEKFTLSDAIQTPAICKIDAVSLVQRNRYTDFSILYQFEYKGQILNNVKMNPVHEIKKNILLYEHNGDTYKMAKRIYALEKQKNNKVVEQLNKMFNGDLGRLYSIISDIGSVLFLLENEDVLPLDKIRYEVGQFRARLGNIFETDGVNTERILKDILALETKDKKKLKDGLEKLDERLRKELNSNATKQLKEMKLLPVPTQYLP